MTMWDFPKYYLDGALVECTSGLKPVCVALLNEEGSILLNCYVVPSGAVVDWRTKDTALSSFNDLLACNPVHMAQVVEYLQHFIPPESILIGHGIGLVSGAFGLCKGEHYACSIDISDWFAVQLSRTLCQVFDLAHILKVLLGDEVPGHESGKRDPMLDAQYARMLYHSYKEIPYDHPIMHQARQSLYEGLPKEKRLVDPALTVQLSGIPEGMTSKDIKKSIIPRQVVHLVDRIMDIKWADEEAASKGNTVVVFKSIHDVSQMILRLHSNPDDWDWIVKKEGQLYTHKKNGIRIQEVEDIALKVYVHSIPDDWSEEDVKRRLVPQVLLPHVFEVKSTQFRRTKDKSKMLGRTHILFNYEWCVMEMLRVLQVMGEDWSWTTQQDASLLFTHKKNGILVEPAQPITFEQLMSSHDEDPVWDTPQAPPVVLGGVTGSGLSFNSESDIDMTEEDESPADGEVMQADTELGVIRVERQEGLPSNSAMMVC